MKNLRLLLLFVLALPFDLATQAQTAPDAIQFVRQGVRRLVFDQEQSIPLAALKPTKIIRISAMYPIEHKLDRQASVTTQGNELVIQSEPETQTSIWFGGFNPFATYTLDLASSVGQGEIGFVFSDAKEAQQFFVTMAFADEVITGAWLRVLANATVVIDESIVLDSINKEKNRDSPVKISRMVTRPSCWNQIFGTKTTRKSPVR